MDISLSVRFGAVETIGEAHPADTSDISDTEADTYSPVPDIADSQEVATVAYSLQEVREHPQGTCCHGYLVHMVECGPSYLAR